MSIFKVNQWWSSEKLQSTNTSEGSQNSNCLKVDKFNSHNDGDCILVGDDTVLKIYKPNAEENASNVLLETELSETILQIETGKFVAGSEDRQILVLHPQSYAIYHLYKQEGHNEAGEQNQLKPIFKHSFTRKANSLTCGTFDKIKTRDFICIQALDGSLSFFDQEIFLFMYIFDDVIIPGPVCYIASSDCFVICKSTWVLEVHSYQQLREFSELKVRQNKKNIPQWVYNAGEEVSSVQIIQAVIDNIASSSLLEDTGQSALPPSALSFLTIEMRATRFPITSSNFYSIIALGERHICCFQDNGLMKFMIRFDFMPICFCAYLIGWYYEPGARLLVMVASEDSKLNIYEGTTLLWSCDLLHKAISLCRCFVKSLPGGIVALSTNGIVTVSYLGTEPDLNANAVPMINENTDPEKIQIELETVEESLQKILEGKEDADDRLVDRILKIKADVGKPIQDLHQPFRLKDDETLYLLMCPIVVILSCEDPTQIQSIQITFDCRPPFACSESTVCLDTINGTEIMETQVFLSSEADVPESGVKIMFTIIDSTGKINVLVREVLLPLSLYCLPTQVVAENDLQLHIQTNQQCIEFSDIFTDFSKEELTKFENNNSVTFAYRTTKKTVTLKTNGNEYSMEANDVPEFACILVHFIYKLTDHYTRMNVKDFSFNVKFNELFTKQVTHRFLKAIETHAKERIKLKSLEDELNVLQRQFTLVQKKLLVQYGSLPPGDCEPLEFLMKDTHKQLSRLVHEIIRCKETVSRAGSTLTAIGHVVICILKQTVTDVFKVKLIEEMLTLNSLHEHYQEWEDAVNQALSYIVNKVFQKSEKDKEKLATVTEQGILSPINLKRFMKQIRLILDRMFLEVREESERDVRKFQENRVIRIEELVDVI